MDKDKLNNVVNRREAFCANTSVCPECNTQQVQLVSWFSEGVWKCRLCKYKWTTELPEEGYSRLHSNKNT